MNSIKETDIQRQICEYLELKKIFFYRNNNTPIYDARRKTFRAMPKYALKGVPDVIAVIRGQYVGIEVKKPKAYLSPNQKIFRDNLELAGGKYILARSIEDLGDL